MTSCKKKETKSNFLEVTIDGKTYRDERPFGVSLGEYIGDFCESKPDQGWYIMEIDLTSLYFAADIACYENDIDFNQSTTGSYQIVDKNFYLSPCLSNLDIVLYFNDNTVPGDVGLALQSEGRVHTITSITAYDQSDVDVSYSINGTFSCTFKNNQNRTYSISGKYQTTISCSK
jgi:hypothetical protein